MVHRIAALLCALVATAGAEIDFTPISQKIRFDGGDFFRNAFHNGSDFILYEPPAGWTMEGQGTRLQLRPKDLPLASATVESRPLAPGTAITDDHLDKLQKALTASLPREAENVTWEPVEVNPLLMNRHETRRLTVSYAAFAQRFKITVVVCHFQQQQILFRFDSRADDFDKQYDLFRRSLYTWQGLP